MSVLTKWNPFRGHESPAASGPAGRGGRGQSGQFQNPFREMEEMMRSLQQSFFDMSRQMEGQESEHQGEWLPSVDIGETEKEFILKAELPEVHKEDIRVSIENGNLCISGERKAEHEEHDMRFHRIERAYGRFERTFTLPEETEVEKVTSEFKDGILTVHLPKNPEIRPESHQVQIQ